MSAEDSEFVPGTPEHDRVLRYMRMAIEQAWRSQTAEEVPVGCVVVLRKPSSNSNSNVESEEEEDEVLVRAFNQTSALMNGARHCEMVCLEHIGAGPLRPQPIELLRRCDLFVTCEPCLMCAYALRQAGLGRVFYGCGNLRFGGCGSVLRLHDRPDLPYPELKCWGGFLEEECVELFRRFYGSGNPNAPEHKRARSVLAERPLYPIPENGSISASGNVGKQLGSERGKNSGSSGNSAEGEDGKHGDVSGKLVGFENADVSGKQRSPESSGNGEIPGNQQGSGAVEGSENEEDVEMQLSSENAEISEPGKQHGSSVGCGIDNEAFGLEGDALKNNNNNSQAEEGEPEKESVQQVGGGRPQFSYRSVP